MTSTQFTTHHPALKSSPNQWNRSDLKWYQQWSIPLILPKSFIEIDNIDWIDIKTDWPPSVYSKILSHYMIFIEFDVILAKFHIPYSTPIYLGIWQYPLNPTIYQLCFSSFCLPWNAVKRKISIEFERILAQINSPHATLNLHPTKLFYIHTDRKGLIQMR